MLLYRYSRELKVSVSAIALFARSDFKKLGCCKLSKVFQHYLPGECADKDECALGYCGSGQQCINTKGSFRCNCSPGMIKVSRSLKKINR